ncbi:MAG: transglutaminase family protein [Victivallaceae bacterium]
MSLRKIKKQPFMNRVRKNMNKIFIWVFFFQIVFGHYCFSYGDYVTVPDSDSLERLCAFYVIHRDPGCLSRIFDLMELEDCNRSDDTVHMLNKLLRCKSEDYSSEECSRLLGLASSLRTFLMKGRYIRTLSEVDCLSDSDIDIGRALILAEFHDDPDIATKADIYSYLLDILALRVKAGLRAENVPSDDPRCIDIINKVLFEEMGIRFPSKGEMFSDKFTFLSSLIQDRYGVCLGVSSLYLSIAVRIGLPLEIRTPPGHIYLSYLRKDGSYLNIETTAGGIHLDTKNYEGFFPEKNRKRELKEVIGLSFMNRGFYFLKEKKYDQAIIAYRLACRYIPDDHKLKELYGWSLLFSGHLSEGRSVLEELSGINNPSIAEYLRNELGIDAVECLLSYPGDSSEALNGYVDRLSDYIKKYPKSKEIYRRLAHCLVALGKYGKSIEAFEKSLAYTCDEMEEAVILAQIGLIRMDYALVKKYFRLAEQWAVLKNFYPEPLKELSRQVMKLCPDYDEDC